MRTMVVTIVVGVLVVLFVAAVYRASTDRPLGCRDDEPRKFAVLREVKDRIDGQSVTEAQVDALRAWARTIEDRCLRAEYLKWIAFFDGENKRRRKGPSPREVEADRKRREQWDETFKQAEALRSGLPKPPTR
jgi:hypothetical protein